MALVASALAAGPSSAAAARTASHFRDCGAIPARIVSSIVAENLRCEAARSIAYRYVGRVECYQHGCSVGAYRCRRQVLGYESYHARCVDGRRIARFDYGA